MEVKHTPGPWYALPGRHNISIRHKTGDSSLPMITVASVKGHFPECCPYGSSKANVLLILAAPDLLSDLRDAAAVLRRYESLHRAKGTTESEAKADANARLAARFETTIAKATQ